MSDLICKKTMRRCMTESMCAPFHGCGEPSITYGPVKNEGIKINHQNLLLQDDPFAVPDSIEHLPSQHSAAAAPQSIETLTFTQQLALDERQRLIERVHTMEARLATAVKGWEMYEHVRTMSARAFTDLWCASISGGSSFDDLVLGDMEKRKGDRA